MNVRIYTWHDICVYVFGINCLNLLEYVDRELTTRCAGNEGEIYLSIYKTHI